MLGKQFLLKNNTFCHIFDYQICCTYYSILFNTTVSTQHARLTWAVDDCYLCSAGTTGRSVSTIFSKPPSMFWHRDWVRVRTMVRVGVRVSKRLKGRFAGQ